MKLAVRRAGIEDVALAADLLDAYRQFYGQASDPAAAREFLSARLQRDESVLLIAFDEAGVAAGFVQLYPLFSSVRLCREWLLNDLFVVPSARRRGVGAALLRHAADIARHEGVASLSLSTALDNLDAQSLYERLGWSRDTAFCTYALKLPP